MYVYKTTCLIDGKIYIGQSSKSHINHNYLGSGLYLLKAVKKYTPLCFIKEILKVCENQRQLNIWEQIYIKKFDAMNPDIGYNLCKGGQGDLLSSPMLEESARLKVSLKLKGKMSGVKNPMYGVRGKDAPFFGKQHSEEHKRNIGSKMMGEANVAKRIDVRNKISAARKGFVMSEEQKEKIRNSVIKTKRGL